MNKAILLPLLLISFTSCRQNPDSQVKDVVLSPAEMGKAHQVIWLDGTTVKSGTCPATSATPVNHSCQGLTAGPTATLKDFSDALTVAIHKSRPDGNTGVVVLDPVKLAQIEDKIKRLSDKIAAGGLTPVEKTSLESQVASLKLERDKLKVELTEAEVKDKEKILNALKAGQDMTFDEGERLFGYAVTALKSASVPPPAPTTGWSDVTVAGTGEASCDGSPENCTMRDNFSQEMWSPVFQNKLQRGDADRHCTELKHNGYDDWLLPVKDQLVFAYHHSVNQFLRKNWIVDTDIDRDCFFSDSDVWNAQRGFFATACVSLKSGSVDWEESGTWGAKKFVCVRKYPRESAPPAWSDVTVAGTGAASCDASPENCTKRDNKTGIMWSKMSKDPLYWRNAVKYCDDLTHNGASDWRLPTSDELHLAAKNYLHGQRSKNWIDTWENWFWSKSVVDDGYGNTFLAAQLVQGNRRHFNKSAELLVACVR